MDFQIPDSIKKAWLRQQEECEATLPAFQKRAARAIADGRRTELSPEELHDFVYSLEFEGYLLEMLPDEPFEKYKKDRRYLRNPCPWGWKFAYLEDLAFNVQLYVYGDAHMKLKKGLLEVLPEMVVDLCREVE